MRRKEVELAKEGVSLKEFYARPTIMSAFPLTFEGSPAKWTEFNGSCSSCDSLIPNEDVRGEVHPHREEDYRSSRTLAYYVDSMGYCRGCELLTPFRYLLTSEMEMATVRGRELLIWGPPKKTLWQRFKSWLTDLLTEEVEEEA